MGVGGRPHVFDPDQMIALYSIYMYVCNICNVYKICIGIELHLCMWFMYRLNANMSIQRGMYIYDSTCIYSEHIIASPPVCAAWCRSSYDISDQTPR